MTWRFLTVAEHNRHHVRGRGRDFQREVPGKLRIVAAAPPSSNSGSDREGTPRFACDYKRFLGRF